MSRFSPTTIALSLLLCMLPLAARADDPAKAASAAAPPSDIDIDLIPVAAAPVGAPHERIASGARGLDTPPVLFASSTTGGTIQERPTFYWYLPKGTDCDVEMDLVRMDSGGRTSVFKKVWEGVKDVGVYSFEASEADGKPLQMNVEYQVTVTVMISKTQNSDSSGFVTRVAAPAGITPDSDAVALAKAGIWYDAIANISRKIDADPTNQSARKQRRGLLWSEHVFSQVSGQSDSSASQSAEADRLREFVKYESKSTGK